jgi:PPOX class probable F420-dependent enzyme
VELPADVIEVILAHWPVARLATVAEGGRPALFPVVFARAAGALWSPVDGKPKRSAALARLRHVARDPRVALLLDHYDTDWTRLWWLRVDGAARVHRAPDPNADPELAVAAAALRRKYPQYATLPLFRGEPTLLAVAPERTASWCASPAALAALQEEQLR